MKLENLNVDQMQVFVIINKGEMKINADENVKLLLTKLCLIKNLFGIQVIVSVNLINRVILASIQSMKTVNIEKNQFINQLKNVLNC